MQTSRVVIPRWRESPHLCLPRIVKKHGSLTDSDDDCRYSEKAIRKRSSSLHGSVGWISSLMALCGLHRLDRLDRRVFLDVPTIVEVRMILPTWRPRFTSRYLRWPFLLLNYKYCYEAVSENGQRSSPRRLSYYLHLAWGCIHNMELCNFFFFLWWWPWRPETKVGAAHWGSPIRGSTNPTKQTSSLLSG